MYDIAKIFSLRQFSKDKFVSKQVLTTQNMGVNVFFLETNQSIAKRKHPNNEIFLYIVDGMADIVIDTHRHTLNKEEMLAIPKDIFYSITNPVKGRLVMLSINAPKETVTVWK